MSTKLRALKQEKSRLVQQLERVDREMEKLQQMLVEAGLDADGGASFPTGTRTARCLSDPGDRAASAVFQVTVYCCFEAAAAVC